MLQNCRRMGLLTVLASLVALCSHVLLADSLAPPFLTETFLSKPFPLRPGGVYKQFDGPMRMPTGHIALKALTGEIVDESGASVPLSDVYLHHWIAATAYVDDNQDSVDSQAILTSAGDVSKASAAEHPGDSAFDFEQIAAHHDLSTTSSTNGGAAPVYFGVGAETRKTDAEFPASFALEIGKPSSIPAGKKLIWWSQVHAIDTRGAVSAKACLECRCDVYNATKDERGSPLPEGYAGGLLCCYEGVTCRVADDYVGTERTYYMKYTVKWVEMNPCVVPLRRYTFDVTGGKIEYNVDSCAQESGSLADCVDTKSRQIQIPESGRLVLAVGHLHVGATGMSLKREDGLSICDSLPIYGLGDTAGDEAGYVTGMRSCTFPSKGPRISANESLTVSSTYSRLGGGHTGVMGILFMAVAFDQDSFELDPMCGQPQDVPVNALDGSWPEVQSDEAWQVSAWGALGGFLIGTFVTASIAGLAIILMKQEHSMEYVPMNTA